MEEQNIQSNIQANITIENHPISEKGSGGQLNSLVVFYSLVLSLGISIVFWITAKFSGFLGAVAISGLSFYAGYKLKVFFESGRGFSDLRTNVIEAHRSFFKLLSLRLSERSKSEGKKYINSSLTIMPYSKKALAFLVDWLMTIAIGLVVFYVILNIIFPKVIDDALKLLKDFPMMKQTFMLYMAMGGLACAPIGWILYFLLEVITGRTVGKLIFGAVLLSDDKSFSIRKNIIRYTVKSLGYILISTGLIVWLLTAGLTVSWILYGIGIVWNFVFIGIGNLIIPLTNPSRKTLYDKISGTTVYTLEKENNYV